MQPINPRLKKSTRSGAWLIAYTEQTEPGKYASRTRSTGVEDRSEAERIMNDWLRTLNAVAEYKSSTLITDLLDNYERVQRKKGKGVTQFLSLGQLRDQFAGERVADIDSERVHRYEKERGVASATARRELAVLRAAIRQGVKDKMLTLADVPLFDLPEDSEPIRDFLTKRECDDFLRRAMEHTLPGAYLTRLTLFVWIGIHTGARAEAIRDLTWSRVNLDDKTIDFMLPGVRTSNKRRIVTTISEELLPVLQQAYKERRTEYVLHSNKSIRKMWDTWLATTPYCVRDTGNAKRTRATPHLMRKTFASLAIQNGVPLEYVAEALGDSLEITRKHYGHLTQEAKARAVNWRSAAGKAA